MAAEPAEPAGETRVEIADEPGQGRYAISVGGEPAGFTQYRDRGAALAFVHTEIDRRFEGRGLAGRLIAHALDDARSRGLAVLPFCPYVRGYVERHREYLDLVPTDRRAEFGLDGPDAAGA